MDATTIRVREPRELLALLPYQLGFRPEHSAVAVALRPPRGRVGLVARVDLVDLADHEGGPQLARRLVTHLVGDGADRAVLVLYTGADPRGGQGPCQGQRPVPGPTPGPVSVATSGPGSGRRPVEHPPAAWVDVPPAVRHFRSAAGAFLGEVPVWVVCAQGYLSLDCADDACCPPGGRPLVELESTEVGAHMVLAGAMVADSRELLVPEPSVGAQARRNAVRAAARWAAQRSAAEQAGPAALAAWRLSGLRAWRSEVATARTGDAGVRAAALARVGVALADVAVRDAVLLSLVASAGDLPERSLAPRAPDDAALSGRIADLLGSILSPRDGVPPDEALHASSAAVLDRVAAHQRPCERAPTLTLLALLAWWHGDGARAGVLLDRARGAEPGYRLGRLLREALAAGLAPGWVQAQP
ncbi:DUF4192 domain-containing protein [Cellulomonas aerilata]|uniref:DUF4192 domain-containing protein n=1 Tax=Cellulomonas aerilata TaxID=515326 RepID=A0A512DBU4_9CELL|nr:DUF4192 domain-containing protein [Cellulomonas aerilata]GEO33700.1 hypothetical protein CAE01nite_14250 [Cellulomonas aerilata]